MNPWFPNLIDKIHPEVERAVTRLYELITKAQPRLDALEARANETFVSKETLNRIAEDLTAAGSSPLNVGGLIGLLSQPQKAMVTIMTASGTPSTPVVVPPMGALIVQGGQLFYFDATNPPGQYRAISAQAIILFDTYANWTSAKYDPVNLQEGTLIFITDWNVLYVIKSVASVHTWVYVTGEFQAVIASQPVNGFNGTALGTADLNLQFGATDTKLQYRWDGAAWVGWFPVMGGVYPANDLNGTFPNPPLNATGVTAATYGDATHVPQIAVDTKGRISSASNVVITGVPPGGAAGGSLAGTYPNPTIAASGTPAGTFGTATTVPVVTVQLDGRVTNITTIPINLGGITHTVPLAALTALGTQGSITFVNGIASAFVDPT